MSTLVKVFAEFKYLLLTLIIAVVVIAFAAWLPNLHLITKTMSSTTMTLWEKTNLITSLLGSLQTNFTTLSLFTTVSIAILTGIQSSLFVYYLKQSFRAQKEIGISFVGISLSLIGVGCVSCGSVVLTSLIGLSFTTAIITYLPFRGQEFGFIGIAIMLVAINLVLKKIKQPYSCKLGEQNEHKLS